MDNIKKGRVLRDTLFGKSVAAADRQTAPTRRGRGLPRLSEQPDAEVRIGSATFKATTVGAAPPQELVVVIKEYEKALVEARTTRQGHPVREDAKNELRLHALLCREPPVPSPHIVRLYDLRADATHYYAVLEYCSKGEFFAFVSHESFTREHARHFFRQLATGVTYMHARGVAHRDLSLENILLDEAHVLKICDFGVACETRQGDLQPTQEPVGKLKYMAPEVFARHPYCARKADVWSMGVILFIMLVQVFPFDRPTLDDDRFVHACSGRINHMLAQWQRPLLDDATIDLLQRIFCPVDTRLEAAQILQHPYCTGQPMPAAAASSSSSAAAAFSSAASPATSEAMDTDSAASSSAAAAAASAEYQRQVQQQQEQLHLLQQQQAQTLAQQPLVLQAHHFTQ